MFGFFRKKTVQKAAPAADREFIRQLSEATPSALAAQIAKRDFVAVEDPGADQSGGVVPLMIEVDGYPALVAFTSQELVPAFVEQMGYKEFKDDIPAFVLGGRGMLAGVPEGVGLALNPFSDAMWVLPPNTVAEVRTHLGRQ